MSHMYELKLLHMLLQLRDLFGYDIAEKYIFRKNGKKVKGIWNR